MCWSRGQSLIDDACTMGRKKNFELAPNILIYLPSKFKEIPVGKNKMKPEQGLKMKIRGESDIKQLLINRPKS